MKLVLFGDSICYGYGARPGESWAAIVKNALETLPNPINVINAGANGETSQNGLRRLKRIEMMQPDAVYIQFGLNDASGDWPGVGGLPNVMIDEYIDNMETIVQRLFACGTKIIFLATNHPVNEAPYGMIGYQERVKEYNAMLREKFSEGMEGLVFIDLERGIKGDSHQSFGVLLAPDGVHLSRAGNLYYATILGAIFKSRLIG